VVAAEARRDPARFLPVTASDSKRSTSFEQLRPGAR